MLNPPPNLDDRRWADLVEEGRALIPLYGPRWTDHNVTDPGITIIEALASVTEMDIYQLNRIPERNQRKFLALVGIRPRPPIPAHTVLQFVLADKTGAITIPEGAAVATADAQGVDIPFRVPNEFQAISGAIASVIVKEAGSPADYSQRFAHGEPIPVFGSAEVNGAELYLGLTEAPPPDVWISLYFRFSGVKSGHDELERILAEAQAHAKQCAPPPNPCAPSSTPPPPAFTLPAHQSVSVAWEYFDSSGTWSPLGTQDDTRSLTLNGTVKLKAPGAMSPGGVTGGSPQLHYLRVRFVRGIYDAEPMAERIVLNGAFAEQTTSTPKIFQTQGNGEFDQVISLTGAPVVARSVQVESVESNVPFQWQARYDFDACGRTCRGFVLDAEKGTIQFGNGENGVAPPAGCSIEVSYLVTRATQGNLPEGHSFKILAAFADSAKVSEVVNPVPASGGMEAETVIAASGRAIEKLRHPQRAITSADYETLSLETPGTDLARVAVVPNCHPAFDCIEAPGVITVIPMTHLPDRAPTPSGGTLSLVKRYLNRRRMIGTRIEVVAPRYIKVAVRTTVQSLPGTSPVLLAQRVSEALDNFLHPLRGGPGQDGWTTGRDVYRSEIMQVVDGVNGVDHVLSLELQSGDCGPVCGNVCVPALWSVTAGSHYVQIV